MTAEITWINHAGFELTAGGLKIVHDPWLVGTAFDNGWSLLSKTVFNADDFADVDYIWFSHEHPDHFSVPSIKSIPQEYRGKITVLFQETKDKRVVKFCEKAGFRVLELKNGVRTNLNDQVAVTCGAVLGRDSWLFTETPDATIFNANDCVGVNWEAVAAELPRDVDVLMTQFSFANWVGNPGDHDRMRQAAEEKLHAMQAQIDVFKPHIVMPFASYVWFSHEKNFHMNEHANKIGMVAEKIGQHVDVVILYPGDRYKVGEPNDNSTAIARYEADGAQHQAPLRTEEASIVVADLIALSQKEQKRIRKENWMWALTPLKSTRLFEPISIYLDDLGEGISYSMFGGILSTGLRVDECDMSCSSASFAGMLRNGYGYSTLMINARYVELRPGVADRLSRHFAIAARNEEGDYIPGLLLRRDYVIFQLRRLFGLANYSTGVTK
ncbi:MAG: MBL fold metallo-hydrolase [Sphingomonadales bacterium]|jgi:UDP-MurNAc hydroxylase|nr:MBL fold metallo-hydrolase [Sphingomonadales bacterium]MBK9003614.1 MBL fold metallo-hydrolase [Sphingomonadales bacterium]MBK9268787.1 MBL fold metallo-hydrolase [Sphingomonadales bacterium]MBP6433609.1 MBL fold metallo-hydrolase [Sphingorhabdus sp.]